MWWKSSRKFVVNHNGCADLRIHRLRCPTAHPIPKWYWDAEAGNLKHRLDLGMSRLTTKIGNRISQIGSPKIRILEHHSLDLNKNVSCLLHLNPLLTA